jgi:hypothetical protein
MVEWFIAPVFGSKKVFSSLLAVSTTLRGGGNLRSRES